MEIFISYKQTWIDKEELNNNLWEIRYNLNDLWFKNNIYYLDEKRNNTAEKVLNTVKNNIIKSGVFIAFINHPEKSEWQLLELGIAEWLWKKIILLVNNKVKDKYFLTYWLNSKLIYFNSLEDINFKKILL